MSEMTENNQQRRFFLGILLGGIGATLAAALGWSIFRFLAPRATDGEGSLIHVAKKDVPVGGAHFFNMRGRPAVLLQPKPGDYVALSAVCTHLGCIVKWENDKGEFLCPCHGGRFSVEGQVLGGPPPKPLAKYPVKIEDADLVVG